MKRTSLIVWALCGVAFAAAIGWGAQADWVVERHVRWVRATGWTAIVTLALALSATPVGRALERLGRASSTAVSRVRRALGIAAAALASAHLGLALATLLDGSFRRLLDVPWMRAGAVAASILGLLWLTSYPKLVATLRLKHWKVLHRLSYVAGALALQHAVLSPMSSGAWLLGLGAVVLLLAPLRWLPKRSRPRPTP